MDLERLLQIEELFHAAREVTAGERAVLLSRADREVRTEVVALLSQQASEGFLDRPAIQNAVGLLENSMGAGLVPGDRLGAYRIESKLGEGWEQTPANRFCHSESYIRGEAARAHAAAATAEATS